MSSGEESEESTNEDSDDVSSSLPPLSPSKQIIDNLKSPPSESVPTTPSLSSRSTTTAQTSSAPLTTQTSDEENSDEENEYTTDATTTEPPMAKSTPLTSSTAQTTDSDDEYAQTTEGGTTATQYSESQSENLQPILKQAISQLVEPPKEEEDSEDESETSETEPPPQQKSAKPPPPSSSSDDEETTEDSHGNPKLLTSSSDEEPKSKSKSPPLGSKHSSKTEEKSKTSSQSVERSGPQHSSKSEEKPKVSPPLSVERSGSKHASKTEEKPMQTTSDGGSETGLVVQEFDSIPQPKQESSRSIILSGRKERKTIRSTSRASSSAVPLDTTPTAVFETTSDQDDAQKVYIALLDRKQIPPQNLHDEILQRLKDENIEALLAQDYDKSVKVHEALALMSQYESEKLFYDKQSEDLAQIEIRLQRAREKLVTETNEWNKYFSAFKQQEREARSELLRTQSQEEADFESNWGGPDFMIPFNKPSPQLLQLRKIQKSLALTKNFQDAKQVKLKADFLQSQEAVDAERRAISVMRLEHQKLIEKHEKELSGFEEHQKRTEQYLIASRYSTCHPLEMLIKQLENARDKDKPTNLKPPPSARRLVPNRNKILTNSTSTRSAPAPSLQTTAALIQFKRSDEPIRLGLSGLNVKQALGRPRPKTSVSRIPRK